MPHMLFIDQRNKAVCSCGWHPESACPQDQIEEFDEHTQDK